MICIMMIGSLFFVYSDDNDVWCLMMTMMYDDMFIRFYKIYDMYNDDWFIMIVYSDDNDVWCLRMTMMYDDMFIISMMIIYDSYVFETWRLCLIYMVYLVYLWLISWGT